jgi:hypothetical protein
VGLTGADLTGADVTETVLAGAEFSGTRFASTTGAAIAVFHARNATHWSTGQVMTRIADDLGLTEYQEQVEPAIEHVRAAGLDTSAPRTSATPPPISWA